MSLFLRGLLWFGLYVLVTVLPLGLALWADPAAGRAPIVEFSLALGLMAFSIAMFQFALVSRLRASSRPFGTDALIQFHQQMGLAVLLFALAHPLLLARHGVGLSAWSPFTGPPLTQTGAVALWGMVIVVFTSVCRKRLRLSYEGWQILHLVTAVVIVGALVWHVLTAGGASRAPLTHGILIVYATVFLALAVRYRLVRPMLLARRPWEILHNVDIGGSTRLLRLRPVGHEGFRFDPGQFAWLITGRSPAYSQQHPLSLASSAEPAANASIEFSIKALGDWSGRIVPALAPGARVWVDGPFGAFTPERAPGQGFVLIAGGIGIAPMRSMLLTMRDRADGREILLIDAVHDPTRLLFGPELDDLARTLHLRVVYVFEEPPKDWTGERGHITTDLLRRHLPAQFLHFQYFVCGPVPMMDALESILTGLGIPAASVHTERFEMV